MGKKQKKEAIAAELARRAGIAEPEQAAPPATPPAAVPAEPKSATKPEPASKPPAPPSTAPATEPAVPAPKPAAVTPAVKPAPAAPAIKAPPMAAIPKLPPPAPTGGRKPATSGDTRAGIQAYNDFFSLYAQSLGNENIAFWPLGFIPGPALVTYGDEVIVAATPDVARGLGKLPCSVAALPQRVRQAMAAWADLSNGLGYQPTAWNQGDARQVLEGRMPSGLLVMGMPRFRYRPGDAELPFGVVLQPASGGLRLERVYSPTRVPDVPRVGAILKLAELKDGRGPVQKLLRTWALMEANFASRYHRDGSPREPRERRDNR